MTHKDSQIQATQKIKKRKKVNTKESNQTNLN